MTMQEMIRVYHKHSASNKYIVGFIRDGKVYYVTITFDELSAMLKACKASSKRGGFNKVRVYVSANQQKAMISNGEAVEICTMEDLVAKKYNKGELFEKVITEKLTGEKWEKDSLPFYEGGDIVLNGENVQVKLNGAELTNEKCLENMLRKMGKVA